jgi:hypothetical protein
MSKRRTKPSTLARRTQFIPTRYDKPNLRHEAQVSTQVVFDAVEKVGALGPHPKAPRHLPGVYYVAAVLGNA